jgi:hypothetical protein
MPLISTWTVTALAMRLRPPRPRLARLLRQPGFVAGTSALSGFAVWMPVLAIRMIRHFPGEQPPHPFLALVTASAVGSAWLVLLAGGRWRAESGWIDRFGRLLGTVWLLPIPLTILSRLIE